ncbi:MAG: hypothetical protein NZ928_02305 [Endomicrobia bacterium]|nr:hypothetical protein [Endomicrobiia bacterium]MDW8055784.1 hypothetical protein [Elusimicrobiota bacterium]
MKTRRTQYLIDKDLQLRYLLYFVGSIMFVSIVVSIVTYLTTWSSVIKEFSDVKLHQDLTTVVRMREYEGVRTRTMVETIPILKEEARMLSKHQLSVIDKILARTNLRVAVVVIITMIFFAVWSIFMSHRIAGPLYRINRELDKFLRGETDVNFKLRKKDELRSISEKLQVLIDKVLSDREKVKLLLEKLAATNLSDEQRRVIEEYRQDL